ncbi:MAG: DMT family transporter [Lentisphaeria bacterium]|nr:DMT family transporter [Lentisphaeria bacterium]
MKKVWGSAAMIIATILWGMAFSAQSRGMDYIDPLLFTSLRSLSGVAALIIVIMVLDLFRYRRLSVWGDAGTRDEKKELLRGGWWCGIVLAIASSAQQYGLKFELSAGKTGFLTALYIVIVPVLGIFFRRKTPLLLWSAVAVGIAGAYILCGGVDNIGKGEWCVILCAVIYSIHILVIDHYVANCDCVRLSCLQFIIASLVTGFTSLAIGESWQSDSIMASLPMWVYCGVGSSAVAFTLQMVSQKYLHPVTATLLMSLESVFAVLGGWLFLNEKLARHEQVGCIVIFIAVILAQLPVQKKGNGKHE